MRRWYLMMVLLVGCAQQVAPVTTVEKEVFPDEHPNRTPNILVCKVQRPLFQGMYLGYSYNSNGLVHYYFDHNNDGKFDTMLGIPQNDHTSRWVQFYTFDLDFDGEPEITFVDKARNGSCKIKEYWIAPAKRGNHDGTSHRA